MSIRNNHWYNLNELRSYPLDDTASCVSSNNELLPSTIIQDLRVRWPEDLGKYAFISAVSVTDYLVTVLIEVSEDTEGTNTTLIAGVTLPLADLIPGQAFRLQAFQDYVGGFISFGNFEGVKFSGIFKGPKAGLIAARAARPSRSPPVTSISVENSATKLTGIVNLTAVEPLSIRKVTKVINGTEYENVLVVSLTQLPSDIPATVELNVEESVLEQFSGNCGKRVGSKNCGEPFPIESINGVYPDCDGVITIEITGCATVGKNEDNCGLIVDCSLGLNASCQPPFLPDLDGVLPLEGATVLKPPPIPEEPPIIDDDPITDEVTTVLALPYCDNFDFYSASWGFSEGAVFTLVEDDSPSENDCCDNAIGGVGCSESASVSFSESYSGSFNVYRDYMRVRLPDTTASSYGVISPEAETRKNITLFRSDVQTLFRKYTTDMKIVSVPGAANRKGGILINHQYDDTTSNYVYYHLELDIASGRFGVKFFNGIQDVTLSYTEIIDLRTNDWYRLSFSAYPSASLTQINFTASLIGITDPTINVTLNTSTGSRNWLPDSGIAGLITNRTRGYFSFWRIEELT